MTPKPKSVLETTTRVNVDAVAAPLVCYLPDDGVCACEVAEGGGEESSATIPDGQ
jgi:hypothetical protein